MIQMKVSKQEAEKELSLIGHQTFQQGFREHWKYKNKKGTDQPTAQSICWLYCWAVAEGRGYKKAGELARQAFNHIFDHSSDWLRQRLPGRVAWDLRYKEGDIEHEFESYL